MELLINVYACIFYICYHQFEIAFIIFQDHMQVIVQ